MSTFDIELEKNADGEYVMPTGGIANFYFTDVDEDDDYEDNYIYGPRGGLHDLKPVAEKLAGFGRYGDDNIAHVETGEFIVPTNIQQENPELMDKLRAAIADYGISPDRYVVGSQENMINPVTGQPEFFKFIKKAFKKIGKAVKKVVSGVKKVVKKVVKAIKPVVGTIATVALTPVVGPIAAGAIGGGIQGLADGKGLKGAIKGAIRGGVTAGVMSGASGALKSIGNKNISLGQGFMSGVRDGFGKTSFMNNIAEKIMPSVPTSAERLMMIKNPGLTWQQAEGVTDYMKNAKIDIAKEGLSPSAARTAEEIAQQKALTEMGYEGASSMTGAELRNALVNDPAAQAKFKELTELNATFDPSMQMTQEEIMQAALKQTGTSATSGFFNFKNADGSMNLGKMATAASIALPLAGAAVGAFDPPPQEDISDEMFPDLTDEMVEEVSPGVPQEEVYVGTGSSPGVGQPGGYGDNGGYTPLVGSDGVGQPGTQPTFVDYDGTTVRPNTAYNPDLMGSFNNNIYYPSQYQTIPGYNPQITGMSPAPFYGYDEYGRPIYSYYGTPDVREANFVPQGSGESGSAMPPEQQFVSAQDVQMAAVGGPMTRDNFPRRTGMIQGPGTETSDDIPAMLSDGEFVMTARAVRGAGGGDRQQGFRKMYDIMRAFEGGAVA
jgi:hypothetical protein